MNRAVMIMFGVLILVGAVVPISQSELLVSTTLTGSTVEVIDLTGLNLTVQLAGGGDKLVMSLVSPEVMKGITVGDRVSLELDVEGRVQKIIKLTPTPQEAPEPRS